LGSQLGNLDVTLIGSPQQMPKYTEIHMGWEKFVILYQYLTVLWKWYNILWNNNKQTHVVDQKATMPMAWSDLRILFQQLELQTLRW